MTREPIPTTCQMAAVESQVVEARLVVGDVMLRVPPAVLATKPLGTHFHFRQTTRGESPLLADGSSKALREVLVRPPDSWLCWWNDRRRADHRASDPAIGLTGDAAPPAPHHDPRLGGPVFVSAASHARRNVLGDMIYVFSVGLQAMQRSVLRFLSEGRVSDGITWRLEEAVRGRILLTVERGGYHARGPGGAEAVIEVRIDPVSGWIDAIATCPTRRAAAEWGEFMTVVTKEWELSLGEVLTLSSATQRVRTVKSPPIDVEPTEHHAGVPIDRGLMEELDQRVILTLRGDPEHFASHPALAPDTLAPWLGVPPRWKNAEGAQLTSVPAAPPPDLALLNNGELRSLAQQLERRGAGRGPLRQGAGRRQAAREEPGPPRHHDPA